MDLVQQGTAHEAGRRAQVFGPAFLIAAVIAAVVSAAILATVLITGSPGRSAVGSRADPVLAPALIEFRAGEHASAATQADPVLAPALIEFRAGEHASAGAP